MSSTYSAFGFLGELRRHSSLAPVFNIHRWERPAGQGAQVTVGGGEGGMSCRARDRQAGPGEAAGCPQLAAAPTGQGLFTSRRREGCRPAASSQQTGRFRELPRGERADATQHLEEEPAGRGRGRGDGQGPGRAASGRPPPTPVPVASISGAPARAARGRAPRAPRAGPGPPPPQERGAGRGVPSAAPPAVLPPAAPQTPRPSGRPHRAASGPSRRRDPARTSRRRPSRRAVPPASRRLPARPGPRPRRPAGLPGSASCVACVPPCWPLRPVPSDVERGGGGGGGSLARARRLAARYVRRRGAPGRGRPSGVGGLRARPGRWRAMRAGAWREAGTGPRLSDRLRAGVTWLALNTDSRAPPLRVTAAGRRLPRRDLEPRGPRRRRCRVPPQPAPSPTSAPRSPS